jgi:hypothetical protein
LPAAYSSANILGARMNALAEHWAEIDPDELAGAAPHERP